MFDLIFTFLHPQYSLFKPINLLYVKLYSSITIKYP